MSSRVYLPFIPPLLAIAILCAECIADPTAIGRPSIAAGTLVEATAIYIAAWGHRNSKPSKSSE